mmetsp:Transcript_22939/g.22250  ORF Transcript_22939/g.22250 Transcript_22939/m.22250 type:complete len:236 (-) Transcript_22939:175-882(-)
MLLVGFFELLSALSQLHLQELDLLGLDGILLDDLMVLLLHLVVGFSPLPFQLGHLLSQLLDPLILLLQTLLDRLLSLLLQRQHSLLLRLKGLLSSPTHLLDLLLQLLDPFLLRRQLSESILVSVLQLCHPLLLLLQLVRHPLQLLLILQSHLSQLPTQLLLLGLQLGELSGLFVSLLIQSFLQVVNLLLEQSLLLLKLALSLHQVPLHLYQPLLSLFLLLLVGLKVGAQLPFHLL